MSINFGTKIRARTGNVLGYVFKKFFTRKRFYGANALLHRLSAKGMGILNPDMEKNGEKLFLEKYLAKNKKQIILDVGGNIGNYAVAILKISPKSVVYSFEPHPTTFIRLQKRAQEKGFTPINTAVGKKKGTGKIYDRKEADGSPHASLYSNVITDIHRSELCEHEINITTIDDFVSEKKIEKIHLLKIDTEGNELDIIHGARETLANGQIDAIHFEFNEMNIISRTFLKNFHDLLKEFDFYRILPDGLAHMRKYDPLSWEIFAYQNIVAVRKSIEPWEKSKNN